MYEPGTDRQTAGFHGKDCREQAFIPDASGHQGDGGIAKAYAASGAKGIGEIAGIPTAPAIQGAYYARDHILRTRLPMEHTFYRK